MRIDNMGSSVPSYESSSATNNNVEVKAKPVASETNKIIVREDSEQNGSNEAAKKQVSDTTIKQAVSDINRKMSSTVAEFGYHEGTNRVTIKIKDKETNEVIKELPPEKTLEMIEKAWELAGLLVDEKR
ncbi:MAG: flagellar protein FlaG [Lachnospiraceae bacterium]|nr:flagellar protein FlaG [Lachnospira sp.]MBR6697146.1 flagellar protein FlaG [Lachnospiraceae bacterium]